ncbi:MAG: phosphohistidine phosphatase SixA [bacterium]
MDLLVIRHGIAMERSDFALVGQDDDDRPLTEPGAKKMRRVAAGLRALINGVDVLASSPLTRAVQTAQIVAEAYGMVSARAIDVLRPENSSANVAAWMSEETVGNVCAIVGHEPNLSQLVTWFMTGVDESRVSLKKGGACLLGFEGKPERGAGTLRWLLTPAQLIEQAR